MTTDAKQDAAQAGLNTGEFDPNKELPVSTLALTESDAMNKLAFSALAPDWVKNQIQGQDGMTPAERAQFEEQLREEALLRETQRLYSERMAQLRWEDEQIVKEMKRMEDETWHHNGKAIFKDPRTGKYIDQDGNVLEGADEDAAKAAEASGQRIGNYDPYKQAKDQHNQNVQEQQTLTNTYNRDMDAYHKAVAEGNTAGAAKISEEASQHLNAARGNAQEIVKSVDAGQKETSVIATLVAESAGADGDDAEFNKARHRGISATTRNTSAANQIAPVDSQQTLTPVFTASASPTPVPDAPTPAVGPKNNVVVPPSPT